jgi:hypothetical protein
MVFEITTNTYMVLKKEIGKNFEKFCAYAYRVTFPGCVRVFYGGLGPSRPFPTRESRLVSTTFGRKEEQRLPRALSFRPRPRQRPQGQGCQARARAADFIVAQDGRLEVEVAALHALVKSMTRLSVNPWIQGYTVQSI